VSKLLSPRRLGAATLLALALVGVSASSAHSQQQQSTRQIPAALVPPAGNVLSATFAAKGVQVYTCTSGAWVFTEPAANLAGWAGRPVTAIHFRGPSWESTDDGSLVTAKAIANSPVAGSIPELLLQSTGNMGDGMFGRVTYIQRLSTRGGAAPTTACTEGQRAGVPYRAEYRFYVAG
jgi:hypothetical protein